MPENSLLRDAQPEDAEVVSILLVQAMGSLASSFTSGADYSEQIALFRKFFKEKHNQYSYQNTIVCIKNDKVIGSVNGYDGSLLKTLRTDFSNYIHDKYGFVFPNDSDETCPGEFYVDCVSVLNEFQGKGVGSSLINAMTERAKSKEISKIGLLVDTSNEKAFTLYQKLGFEIVEKKFFINYFYFHMQKDLNLL